MRLPRVVRLPFGYDIKVQPVTDAEMLIELDSEDKTEITDGLWDSEERTIWIRKGLTMKRKAYVLSHELTHALVDWQHEILNQGVAQA